MLFPSDLNYIRGMQLQAMPDLGTLRTITYPSDGSGGFTEGTASDTPNVPYRLSYNSGGERFGGAAVTPERQYTLTIPSTYVLTPAMRFVAKDATVYEITSVNTGVSWQTVTRASAMRSE